VPSQETRASEEKFEAIVAERVETNVTSASSPKKKKGGVTKRFNCGDEVDLPIATSKRPR